MIHFLYLPVEKKVRGMFSGSLDSESETNLPFFFNRNDKTALCCCIFYYFFFFAPVHLSQTQIGIFKWLFDSKYYTL